MIANRKSILKSLFVAVFLLFSVSALFLLNACDNKKEINIYGFEVSDTETIKQGNVFSIKEPVVKDDEGNIYEVKVLVYNEFKEKTEVVGGRFSANEEGGYTIKYTITVKGEKRVKYTAVKVVKANGPIFTLGEFETRCESGESLALPDVYCENNDVEFTYEIVRREEPLQFIEKGKYESGKKIVFADSGVYSVTVIGTLNGEERAISYLVKVIDAEEKGLVSKVAESDYQTVNPEEEGIGAYSSFVEKVAKTVSTDWYIPYYFKPSMDKDYYQKMADDGFDAVTVWLYLDSSRDHKVYKHYTNGGYSTEDDINDAEFPAIRLKPGKWTAFQINLKDTRKDFRKSFLTAFEEISTMKFPLFYLDNYGSENEKSVTLYIGDIYVTKSKTPVLPEWGDVEIGSVKELPTDESNTEYFLTDGQKQTKVDGAIDFSMSGDYVLTARYTTGCYFGEKKVSVNILPTYNFTFEKKVWNTDDLKRNILPEKLGPSLTDKHGSVATAKSYGYEVFYDGEKVSDKNGGFTADESGTYQIKTYVYYDKKGKTLTDRFENNLDAYDNENKYVFFSPETKSTVGFKRYKWDRVVSVAGESGKVGGRTENFVKLSTRGEDIRAVVKPKYTKTYYEMLAAENPSLKIVLPYYVKTAESYTHVQTFALKETSLVKEKANIWKHKEIGLTDYLNQYYDICYELYETAPIINGGQTGFIDVFTEAKSTELYLSEIRLYETAIGEVTSDNVKINKEIPTKEAFEITINGKSAEILWVSIEYEGDVYAVDDRINIVFGGDYGFIINACAGNKFSEIRYDGHYTDDLPLQKGETLYVTGDNVSVSDIPRIPDGYSVAFTLTDNTGKEVNNAVIVGEDTVSVTNFNGFGAYTLSAYAKTDNATVGRKLFYQTEINYCETKYTYNALNGETGRKDIVLWDYFWGGHTGNKIHTGVHEIDGKEVKSIRATTNYQLFSVQLKPQYSKDYYQRIASEGGKFTFDYYITGISGGNPIPSLPVQIFGSSVQTNTAFGCWHTVVIPASEVAKYYDYLISSPEKTADVAKCSLLGIQNDIFGDITVYLTLPEFVFDPDSVTVTFPNENNLIVDSEIDLAELSVTVNGITLKTTEYSLEIQENDKITIKNGIIVSTKETSVKMTVKVNYITEDGKIYRVQVSKTLKIMSKDGSYDGTAPDPYEPMENTGTGIDGTAPDPYEPI